MSIIGIPSRAKTHGECQICGKGFFGEIILGQNLLVAKLPHIAEELAIHAECRHHLEGELQEKRLKASTN